MHGSSARQMQHEVDVLDQDPGHGIVAEKPEQMVNDGTLGTAESCLVAGHGQVLTREPGGDKTDVGRKALKIGNIPVEGDGREPACEHETGMGIVLA